MPLKPTGLGRGLSSLIPTKPVASAAAASTAVAVAPASAGNGVLEVPIGEIVANAEQPRLTFGHQELEDLMNSIREHGIIQPLTVARREAGGFEIIAGERRFRAAKMLGLAKVPVIVRQAKRDDKLILALIENIQREDLNPLEEAGGYRRLMEEFGLTQEDVSRQVGKARSTVANIVRLLELPLEIREAIADGRLAAGSARAILALKDDASRLRFFRGLVKEKMTTRQVEAGTRRLAGGGRKDPAIAVVEEELRDKYGVRVEVKNRGGRGSISLQFFSDEEYDTLLAKMR
ncbi:hypothetical protein A3C96_02775 [Candidatus Uhrbacteria bacterium RIFCSPHIGHO2_02_FULL_60_10]|uniref:HTH cro/C1-type domain-containing protein n=1 Tax=Candidatus Uhrbacteria bacterium RIFCSPHIGHO2_02_FULL_60_10 TaxID=1802392 RepID=A0A1F7U864_9BACT|nr:MAG: hypothetical protein A3C96_02775 [Candidatus Uhrbacteria bacterium RIFCSPHIGHO2_02_FULL_60_10]